MPAAIGNRNHAKKAVELENTTGHNGASKDANWRRCGRGASRSAWLHIPSGVVYKVERYGHGNNEQEYKNARECSKLEWKRIIIPKVSMFRFESPGKIKDCVLAMEFVDGVLGETIPRTNMKMARKELFEKGGFEDMHGMNFIVTKNKKIAPIDMGSVRHGQGWRKPDERVLTCGNGKFY